MRCYDPAMTVQDSNHFSGWLPRPKPSEFQRLRQEYRKAWLLAAPMLDHFHKIDIDTDPAYLDALTARFYPTTE